jgi:hypothetical protein
MSIADWAIVIFGLVVVAIPTAIAYIMLLVVGIKGVITEKDAFIRRNYWYCIALFALLFAPLISGRWLLVVVPVAFVAYLVVERWLNRIRTTSPGEPT